MKAAIPHILAVVAIGLVVPQAHSATLFEALAMAYGSNPTLLGERARLRATDEGVPQALSGWRPTVQLDGKIGEIIIDQRVQGEGNIPSVTNMPSSLTLTLDQPVYRGGQTTAETKASEALVMAGRGTLVDVEQNVLVDAATAYMDVVRDRSVVELNINNEEVLRRQLQATRDRFEVGEVTRTDVSQAEARLSDAQAQRIAAQGNLEVSRATYEAVVGAAADNVDFPDSAMRPVLPGTEADALTIALKRNPRIVSAQFLERAALHDISAAGGRLLPQVSLNGRLQRAFDPNTFFDRQDTASFELDVTVPLYQAGAEYARVRELRQIAAQRRRELEQAQRDVTEANSRWWEQLVTVRAQIASFQDSVRANGIALEGVSQEAEVGARTVLDVLDAQQELFTARVDLVRARRDEIVVEYELVRVIGAMTATDLGLPVEAYDPTTHYFTVRDKWIGFGSDYQGGTLLDTEGLFDFLR